MMKRLLLWACIGACSAVAAVAQPIFGSRTLPFPYVNFRMNVCDTVGIAPGTAGNGQVWSFVSLIRRGTDTTETSIIDQFGLSPDLRAKFPTATVVVIDDTTSSFYRVVGNQWRLDGRETPSASLVVSPDPYDVRPTEVVFNNPKVDTYGGTFESTMLPPGPKPVIGSHSFTYDGFGRLILPDFSYDNVARITQHDTMSAEFTVGPQRSFLRVTSQTTTWQQPNSSTPLLVIEESVAAVVDTSGTPLMPRSFQKTVRYLDRNSITSVDDDVAGALMVVPSPSSTDHVAVLGQDIASSTVVVINALGQTMSCAVTEVDGGLTLDISQLPCGSYSVLLMREHPGGVRVRTTSFIRQ